MELAQMDMSKSMCETSIGHFNTSDQNHLLTLKETGNNLGNILNDKQQKIWFSEAKIKYSKIEYDKWNIRCESYQAQLKLTEKNIGDVKEMEEFINKIDERSQLEFSKFTEITDIYYKAHSLMEKGLALQSQEFDSKISNIEKERKDREKEMELIFPFIATLKESNQKLEKLTIFTNIPIEENNRLKENIKMKNLIQDYMVYKQIVKFVEVSLILTKDNTTDKHLTALKKERFKLSRAYQNKVLQKEKGAEPKSIETFGFIPDTWSNLPIVPMPSSVNMFETKDVQNVESHALIAHLQKKYKEAKIRQENYLKNKKTKKTANTSLQDLLNMSVGKTTETKDKVLDTSTINLKRKINTSINTSSNRQTAKIIKMNRTASKNNLNNSKLNYTNEKMFAPNSSLVLNKRGENEKPSKHVRITNQVILNPSSIQPKNVQFVDDHVFKKPHPATNDFLNQSLCLDNSQELFNAELTPPNQDDDQDDHNDFCFDDMNDPEENFTMGLNFMQFK